jgi:hypothetical protein
MKIQDVMAPRPMASTMMRGAYLAGWGISSIMCEAASWDVASAATDL